MLFKSIRLKFECEKKCGTKKKKKQPNFDIINVEIKKQKQTKQKDGPI